MKRFTLKNLFKRVSSNPTQQKERRQKERSENNNDQTILIVDDSRTVVAAFTKVLTQAGFKTISASNGAEGVAAAKQHLPNLILMDIVMPGLNGFQATRQIRKNESTSHIPIIIVSGEQQATEQFWGKRVGANAFLTKPVDRSQFFGTILETLKLETV
ncbi:MAG: response regulator [Ectothiorhodospiraceae bacterium]|nr:response regulator [Ectothiorhodospiraceae bacterium]